MRHWLALHNRVSIVIDFVLRVLLISHQLLQFLAEQMNFSEIEWTEVGEERFVDEIVIDAEVEGV